MGKKIQLALLLLLIQNLYSLAQTPWLHTEGKYLKDPAGNIVTLRGVCFQDITGQKNSPGMNLNALIDKMVDTQDTVAGVNGWYAKVVRFTINPTITNFQTYHDNILKPAVDYATSKGLYVIIDNHFIADVNSNVDYTNRFWTFMAPKFRNYSNVLYEVYNEPINQANTWATFKPYMQAWVDLIRSYAPHNILLAGNPLWDQRVGDAAKSPLKGNNIMYVAHIYPGHYTNVNNKNQVKTAAALVPVFLSEWGFSMTATDPLLNGTITNYGESIITWAESLGLSWTAWVADNDWQPAMFTSNWKLKTGDGEMGGFTKLKLYTYKDNKQPTDIKCVAPYLGPDITICTNQKSMISTGLDTAGKTFRWYKDNVLLDTVKGAGIDYYPTKGTYRVEVDSNGCTMKDEINVVDSILGISITPSTVLTDSFTIVAGSNSPDFSYQWYKNNTIIPNANLNSLKVYDSCNTVFTVDVSYTGCGTKKGTFKVLCPRGTYLGYPIPVPGIVQAEYYDYQNIPNTTYFDTDAANLGGNSLRNDAVDIENCGDTGGGVDIGWIAKDEWLEYSINVTDTGTCALIFRVASGLKTASGILHVNINGKDVTGQIQMPLTGDWQKYQNVVFNGVKLSKTDTVMRVYFDNGGFNLNYIKVEKGYVAGIEDETQSLTKVSIYPNPTDNEIIIKGSKTDYDWKIINILGEELISGTGNKANITKLQQGNYIIIVNGIAYKIQKI